MARIPPEEIDRLKREVSLVRLIESRGVELRLHGADLIGLCPFHEDHAPSLVVSPAKNLWHCLGACQAGGSVIDWVMRSEGVSFRHAVELLREDILSLPPRAGMEKAVKQVTQVKRSTVRKLGPVVEGEVDAQEQLQQVIGFYHATLKQSPDALGYLEKRGLRSSEMIDHFQLGFSNRTLGYRLPAKNRQRGAAVRGCLQELGILRSSGHEHFSGSLVIPVFDEHGLVTEVYGRKVTPNLRVGTPDHLYLPGPHRGVWNVQALAVSEEIILCEALIDALTFWCAGFRNVTSSYGIEGFTPDHWEAFQRYGTKRVLIAYDRDEAGDKAAAALAEKLMSEGLECFRIQFPRGMDANAYALSVQPATRSLELVIRQAMWLGKGQQPEGQAPNRSTLKFFEEGAEPIETSTTEKAGRAADEEFGPDGPETRATKKEECDENLLEPHEMLFSNPEEESGNEVHELIKAPSPRDAILPLAAAEEASIDAEADIDAESLQASPLPSAPPADGPLERKGEDVVINIGDRRWRIRGMAKNLSFEQLKVNVLVAKDELSATLDAGARSPAGAFHVDTLDLYSARHRAAYIKAASEELFIKEDIIKRDLGKILLKLEALQEQQIKNVVEPKKPKVTLGDKERSAALNLLQDPRLLDRILEDFARCGVVGEETNKLVGYVAAVSRKLEEPLAIVIQSSSAAGKTSLMEAVLAFLPEEERVKYSAMTGQSLFYMGEADLRHKVLAIVEEEGAERASYALKLLQSEGELTIASTGKDPQTGRLVTHEYRVEGPVMIFLTTTAIEIDEELLNRCLVLTVDEEREQTRAIHRLQRERQTLEGLLARREGEAIRKVQQDAQRLLRPILVANPYAKELTFLDDRTRTRRDHMKYLTLIRAITLLHQYQRPRKKVRHQGQLMPYIEVTLEDISVANRLAHEVLGRSLDELSPQTRRLLLRIDAMVNEACQKLEMERSDYRFSRREVREHTGLGNTQLHHHLDRLVELEYLVVHRGGRGQQFEYELVYDGQGKDGTPFLPGLFNVATLRQHRYDGNLSGEKSDLSGQNEENSGGCRGHFGANSAPFRGRKIGESANDDEALEAKKVKASKNAYKGQRKKSVVFAHHNHSDTEASLVEGA